MPVVKKQKGGNSQSPIRNRQPNTKKGSPVDRIINGMPTSLPKSVNVPPLSLSEYVILLYGAKGIGKSSLAAEFPNALDFMFELGRRNLPIRMVPDYKADKTPLTWPRFKAYRDLILEASGKDRPDTVVIDTIDRAYVSILDWLVYEGGYASASDLKWDSWDAADRELSETKELMLEAGIALVFISHSKHRELEADTDTDSEYRMVCPACTPRCWQWLKMATDYAFFYGYNGQRRTMTIRGGETIWTGCADNDRFLTPDGEAIASLDMGKTPKEAYQILTSSFRNQAYALTLVSDMEESDESEEAEETPKTLPRKKG